MRFFFILEVFFFSRSGSQRLKKRVGVFLIRLRSKVTEHFQNCEKIMRSERTEMAFKESLCWISAVFVVLYVDFVICNHYGKNKTGTEAVLIKQS